MLGLLQSYRPDLLQLSAAPAEPLLRWQLALHLLHTELSVPGHSPGRAAGGGGHGPAGAGGVPQPGVRLPARSCPGRRAPAPQDHGE